MSTDLLSVTVQFNGPFSNQVMRDRLKAAGFVLHDLPENLEPSWVVWMSADRLDPSSADVSLSPSLFARLMEENGISGKLPPSEIDATAPDSYAPLHFWELGQWSSPSRFDAAFLLDARLLPSEVDDFTIDTTAYGDGRKKNSFIFAPASPAETGPVIPITAPSAIAEHKGNIYVGAKDGLYILEDERFKKISLAKKQPPVHTLCSDGDFLYVGAGNGLHKIADAEVVATWRSRDGLPGKAVLTLSRFQNAVFVGASGGTAWIRDGDLTDTKKESFLKNIQQSCVDFSGSLWVGGDKALLYMPADAADFIRVSGYRGVTSMTPFRHGVFAKLFQGNSSIKARLIDGAVEQLDLGPDYLPAVGSLDGDLLIQNGGLVRCTKNGPHRLLFDSFETVSAVEIKGKMWLLGNMDGVCELLPESWDVQPTHTPPVPVSELIF